jgi:N-acetylglucosaminyl-diphospho-decaprenol L-rhamnosyltransferase
VELSYCVTNTDARELALACVDAIKRAHPDGLEHEIIVLDNASQDGSAAALGAIEGVRVITRERRGGAASNRTILLREARGELCLLLDEDTELRPGSVAALVAALRAEPRAAVAGAQLVYPNGSKSPCAWRLPGVGTAIAQLLFLGGALVTQSGGGAVRTVGWVQSAAMLVRREAAQAVGWWDPAFFLYSDETDFQKRLHDAGWQVLHVPASRVVHREQLSTDAAGVARRIVQFHRGRDLYMRKHHSRAAVYLSRLLWSASYLPRALVAAVRPGQHPDRYLLHARQALRPGSGGEGMAEVAEAFNRRLSSAQAERAGE